MGHPGLFFIYLHRFKQSLQFLQQINVKKYPSSIQPLFVHFTFFKQKIYRKKAKDLYEWSEELECIIRLYIGDLHAVGWG